MTSSLPLLRPAHHRGKEYPIYHAKNYRNVLDIAQNHPCVARKTMATTPSHQDFSSRARKNAREKARRQVLNQHYTTLLSFLDLDRSRRMEQTSILRETIAHLNRLMQSHILLVQQNRALHMELNSLKAAAGTPRSEPLTYRERDREEGKLEGSVPPNVSVVAGVNWRRAQRDARVKVVKGVLEAEAHLMAPSNPSTPPTSSSSLNINIPSPLASPAPYGLHVARVSPMSEGTFSNNRVSPKNMVQDRGRLSVTDTRPRSRFSLYLSPYSHPDMDVP
ncbi:hypothetical protein AAMO2058_000437000 [Amorphochlora amoebiformis]